jgi:hypothetical protein
MPYANVPKHLWPKMESCVARVKSSGKGKNAYAICYSSVVGSDVADSAKKRLAKKKGG